MSNFSAFFLKFRLPPSISVQFFFEISFVEIRLIQIFFVFKFGLENLLLRRSKLFLENEVN